MHYKNTLVIWVCLFAAILIFVVFGGLLVPYDSNQMDLRKVYTPPGSDHLLGTDHLGRDVLSRLIEGGKVTLSVTAISVMLSLFIGVIYGGISGYFGGFIDAVLMRGIEVFLTIPSLIIILIFQSLIQGGIWSLAIIIGLTHWFATARIVRSEFKRLKKMEFIQIAGMMGTPLWKTFIFHMLRNSLPSIFVVTIFNFATIIFIEVSLSFLGIGIPPTISSWGTMLYHAQNDILIGAWWSALFPGLMIFLVVLSLNFLGESIKRARRAV